MAAQLCTEQSAAAGAGRSSAVEGRRPARLYCCLPAGEPAHAGVRDCVHHSRHELYHRAVGVAGGWYPLAATKPAGDSATGAAGKGGAAIAAHAACCVALRRVRHGGAAHSGRAGATGADGVGSLCVADGANGPCLGTVPAQPPLGQRSRRGQAERRQYAGDVRRVAAGGRGAVFAPDFTGLRRAAAGSTDCLSGSVAGAGFE